MTFGHLPVAASRWTNSDSVGLRRLLLSVHVQERAAQTLGPGPADASGAAHDAAGAVRYPSVFMTTGTRDGRVNPAQSRKMITRLQAADAQAA